VKGPVFYRGKNDETYNLEKLQKQFLYVELTALESELKKIGSERPSRSCQDVKLEQPGASSGTFTLDPNLGSSLDALKTYCDFDHGAPRTCVKNSTSSSQLGYLHLLHTNVLQTIHLPCNAEGPFRLTPFDEDDMVDISLTKNKNLDVAVSSCNPFNMLREVEFSSTNSAQQLLPFTQPIRFHFEDYHFQDICFY